MKAESGKIDFRFGVGVDAEIAGVGDDADDGDFSRSGTHDTDEDVGTDGISCGEIVACECFIDDEEASGAVDVAPGERSALEEADAHGAEVVGADEADLRIREGARCEGGSAFDEKARHELRRAEGDLRGGGGGEDSAGLRDCFEHLLVEAIGENAVVIAGSGQGDFGSEDVIGTEAGIDGDQLLKAADDEGAEKNDDARRWRFRW